jgi:hypothetical protein
MKRGYGSQPRLRSGPVSRVLWLWLAACGSRAGLFGSDGTDPALPSAGGAVGGDSAHSVEFPSLAEISAVPPPSAAPDARLAAVPSDAISGDECELVPPSLDALLARIEADVLAQPAPDRRFLRYVGTGSLFASYCDAGRALDATADALPLLLNSLSLSPYPARAQLIEADPGLLRIDLRELTWNRPLSVGGHDYADGWEVLGAFAPQALALRGAEADALFEQLGTHTAFLQAQDLVRGALSADAYYALLGAPQSIDELRAALRIPSDLDQEPNAYWRAMTTHSVVSRQERLVLRYRARVDGPLFWRTLDRLPETAAGGAFLDPLTREGDESSAVYALPNGLPAYFLADGSGRRINESRVLLDTGEDDFVPHTAPSCVRCHSDAGVLPVTDELRPYAATDPNGRFDGRQRALIAEVYPTQSALDALFQADGRRIEDARVRAGVPRSNTSSPLQDLLNRDSYDLRPDLVAAELFVSPAALRDRRRELPGALRVLLGTGNLGRASFNEVYHEAICTLSKDWRNQPLDCP